MSDYESMNRNNWPTSVFFLKKSNISTCLDFMRALVSETMSPAVVKTLPQGMDVAGTQR